MTAKGTCQHTSCDRTAEAAGWCNAHYIRQRNGKDMDAPILHRNKGKTCIQDGCENPARARGYCNMHSQRLITGGDMNAPPRSHKGVCQHPPCAESAYCRGYCRPHYDRFRKGQDMGAPIKRRVRSYNGAVCKLGGCDRLAKANGYCGQHWRQERQGGQLNATIRHWERNTGKCEWQGCQREQEKRHLCGPHYERQRQGRYMGDPLGEPAIYNTGADRVVAKGGYIEVRRPGHFGKQRPRGAGWHWEHRYVMECHLGRALREGENVHHINNLRDDNRLENLELWTSCQPAGSRVIDLLDWADEFITRYEPELGKLS